MCPYFDFSTFVSGTFPEKKVPKPFSSKVFTDIQPTLTTYSHSEIAIELTDLCQRFFQWLVGSKSQSACSLRRRCIITSAGSLKVASR